MSREKKQVLVLDIIAIAVCFLGFVVTGMYLSNFVGSIICMIGYTLSIIIGIAYFAGDVIRFIGRKFAEGKNDVIQSNSPVSMHPETDNISSGTKNNFCRFCGQKLEDENVLYCPNCGNKQ
ncbi:MAG: hypothetical protein EOM40_01115 [Clostridia bacterium]|nr:hypothetical protein [Clostridia bacterium]NCC43514.1 hypothetical protein [Clostridia bacterium]